MLSVDWVWKVSARKLLPTMTDLQPAPHKLLYIVLYGCEIMRCYCSQHVMTCSTVCSECKDICANTTNYIDSESDEDT